MPMPLKPTRLHELAGNPSKKKLNRNEPKAKGVLAPPKSLSREALAIFKRLVGAMPPGLYQSVDEALLVAFAEAYAGHQAATAAIAEHGMMTTGSTGQLVVSPWVKIQSDQARLMVTLSTKLGFDPVSRAAITAPEQSQSDEFDGLIN